MKTRIIFCDSSCYYVVREKRETVVEEKCRVYPVKHKSMLSGCYIIFLLSLALFIHQNVLS